MNNGLAEVSVGRRPVDPSIPPHRGGSLGFIHIPKHSRLLNDQSDESSSLPRRAVFLDRDGVLVVNVHYLTSANELVLLPDVSGAIRQLQDLFLIIIVTNQSGVARGFLTEVDLSTIHERLAHLLAQDKAAVDAIYYCPHLAEGTVPGYHEDCSCRKPKPGMLLRASRDFDIDLSSSFLIGDMPTDIQAAEAAGVQPVLLTEAGDVAGETPIIARDLAEAAELILIASAGITRAPTSKSNVSMSTDSAVQRGKKCQ